MHVLIAEHDRDRLLPVVAALEAAGFRVEVVGTGAAALAALARPARPDLLLVGEQMKDMRALDFMQSVVRMAHLVPTVILGRDEAASRWMEATRLGAVDYLVADDDGQFLRTIAPRLVAARARNSAMDARWRLADAFASTAAAVLMADSRGGVEFLNEACARLVGRSREDLVGVHLADLFVLEADPRLKNDLLAAIEVGGEWAGELDVASGTADPTPCIVTLSPIRRHGGRLDGLVLTLRDVSDRVAMEDALRAANRRLAEQAARDALTGIYNRAYFRDVLGREIARAVRYGDELSVLMIDLDNFKPINDLCGHAAGDRVICAVARALGGALRDGDVLARYAGDEFCVLLPNTSAEAALAVAERLRQAIETLALPDAAGVNLRISVGLATSEDVAAQPVNAVDAILTLADDALFASKRLGGNRVSVWHAPVDAARSQTTPASTDVEG